MTATDVTVTALPDYRNERLYPFCPGCGHGTILDAFNRALVMRGTAPAGVVLVSDIGCAGLSDEYFTTSAFHGLHGRSITYATGIKLARPDLDVVVIMGDGGAGIGGAHLLNAARRNIGITVLVFNNLNFGMTGGQHSITTPAGAVTATTPDGNVERPLDLCSTAAVNGAGYVHRGTSFDDDLPDRIAEAMGSGGFALLDIWELCSAYYMRSNRFGKRSIARTLDELGFETGVLARRELPAHDAAHPAQVEDPPGSSRAGFDSMFSSRLAGPLSIVVAGSAGGRVRSAARLLGRAALLSGLWAAQHDDYPVTVRTGHSMSTVLLSPEPIDYAWTPIPDVLAVLSTEGAAVAAPFASRMEPDGTVYTVAGHASVATKAAVRVLEPGHIEVRIGPADLALASLAAVVVDRDLMPLDALLEAAGGGPPAYATHNRSIIEAGATLLSV